MIPLIVEMRAVFIFLAVLIVGVAERNGWLAETDRSNNVEVVAEVMTWTATIVSGIIAAYIQKHKKPSDEGIEVTVTTPKKYSLQPLLNKLKSIVDRYKETPQQ